MLYFYVRIVWHYLPQWEDHMTVISTQTTRIGHSRYVRWECVVWTARPGILFSFSHLTSSLDCRQSFSFFNTFSLVFPKYGRPRSSWKVQGKKNVKSVDKCCQPILPRITSNSHTLRRPTKIKPSPPSPAKYWSIVGSLLVFSLGMGYLAGIQPTNEWRYFSWHPLLMTIGMVGLAGIGAVTKKLGGYQNTKVRLWFAMSLLRSNIQFHFLIRANFQNSSSILSA